MGGYSSSPDAMAALGSALKSSAVADLNIAKNDLHVKDMPGFTAAIRDTQALASLTISENNKIGSAELEKIKQACASKSIKCTL